MRCLVDTKSCTPFTDLWFHRTNLVNHQEALAPSRCSFSHSTFIGINSLPANLNALFTSENSLHLFRIPFAYLPHSLILSREFFWFTLNIPFDSFFSIQFLFTYQKKFFHFIRQISLPSYIVPLSSFYHPR